MLAICQLAFMMVWIWTLSPSQTSIRLLYWRTATVLAFGWWAAANRQYLGNNLLTLTCDLLVWMHIVGLCMAVLNRDSRFFKHRIGGCQEE